MTSRVTHVIKHLSIGVSSQLLYHLNRKSDCSWMRPMTFIPPDSCNRLFTSPIPTPDAVSSFHSSWDHLKSQFNHCGRGIGSVRCSLLEPSQKMNRTRKWGREFSNVNICLVLTHSLQYISSIQNESLYFMPRFALGSFKRICLYRRRLGGALSKQPEPRGKIVNTESPSHSYSFCSFLFVG